MALDINKRMGTPMSTEDINGNIADNKSTDNNETDGRIKNLQSEFSRKTANLDSKLEQINQQLQQMSLLGNQVQPASNNNQRPDNILEPEKYEQYMEQKLEAKINSKLEAQNRQQAEVAQLVNMFPELSDASSDLTKSAIETYNRLSAHEKTSPAAYRLAVQGAALELGMLPKNKRDNNSKRQVNESDDIGAGNQSAASSQNKSQGKGKVKLDEATIAFAKLLGKDVNDPKYVERLQKAASRSGWSKFKNRNEY